MLIIMVVMIGGIGIGIPFRWEMTICILVITIVFAVVLLPGLNLLRPVYYFEESRLIIRRSSEKREIYYAKTEEVRDWRGGKSAQIQIRFTDTTGAEMIETFNPFSRAAFLEELKLRLTDPGVFERKTDDSGMVDEKLETYSH
jgi:hypothetical protein